MNPERKMLKLKAHDLSGNWMNKIEMLAGASRTGIGANASELERYHKELLDAKIDVEVNSLDVRLHGLSALALVTFCYDFSFGLVIGGDVLPFLDYLVELLVHERHLPRETAVETVAHLFPGPAKLFVINCRNLGLL